MIITDPTNQSTLKIITFFIVMEAR